MFPVRPRELSTVLDEAIARARDASPEIDVDIAGEEPEDVWIADPDEQVHRLVGVLASMMQSADGRLALRWQARETRVSVEVQAALRGASARNRLAALSLPRAR